MAEVYTRACPAYGYGHGIIWGRLERPFFFMLSRGWNFNSCLSHAEFGANLAALQYRNSQRLNCDLIRNIVD